MTVGVGVVFGSVRRWRGGVIGCLVIGAEPADVAALLLGSAFVVEGDEAGEEGVGINAEMLRS